MSGNPTQPTGASGPDGPARGTPSSAFAGSQDRQAGRAARRLARRSWTMAADDPAAVLAEARKALYVMAGILAALWIIQIINSADGYRLTFDYGIRPRALGSLPDILTAPFLHFSWTHIEGNSGPLFIFGFLAAYRGVAKFAGVTVLVVLSSGLAAWLFESPGSVGAGASGVVFGYFGYIMVRGFFDRHAIDLLIGAVMALCFAYQFSVLLPQRGIGWQAHIGGLVGGILAGWVFRDRRTVPAGPARPPGSPPRPASRYDGPRGDLHKQLDDLGL
ncbi:MAG TPA: rhomboid family intramembrane serine protease [Streptosporangiaceae bacterium]|nr:rhomboid family intramembrane serine protease [Streptosporangiaceae bacterium]